MAGLVIAPAERHAVMGADQVAARDGNTVDRATPVANNLFGQAERWLNVG